MDRPGAAQLQNIPSAAPQAGPNHDRSRAVQPRGDHAYAPRAYGGRGYAVPRPHYAPRYYGRRYYGRPYYAKPYYARPYYYRPYVFRPHLTLGFGIYAGYPFAYPYAYPYPVPVYGYGAPADPVVVGPQSPYYGGVSLEFTPAEAAVYVDGNYAGTVGDFDGTQQPLNLPAGQHRIDLQAPGYEPLGFDVTVTPGQVVPYRGDMLPARF